MDKKGLIVFNMLTWIIKIFFYVMVVGTIFLIVNSYFSFKLDTKDAEAAIFTQRLIYSPNGLSYYDPLSNRLYPGIIDLSKIQDTSTINKSIFYGEESRHIGAKIIVEQGSKKTIGIYNPNVYKRIVERGFLGRGGVDVMHENIYVLTTSNLHNLTPGNLKLEIVIPRS